MLAVAKCDRLAAVPQLLLSFELFLQNTKASKTISNKVRAPIPWECPVTTSCGAKLKGRSTFLFIDFITEASQEH